MRFVLVGRGFCTPERGPKSRFYTVSVESTTGAVAIGVASLFPHLSVRGAPLAAPWLRFQSPLIEPDMQISRIRLSDKTHAFAHGKSRVSHRATAGMESPCGTTAPASCTQPSTPPPGRSSAPRIEIRVVPSLQHVVPSAAFAHCRSFIGSPQSPVRRRFQRQP